MKQIRNLIAGLAVAILCVPVVAYAQTEQEQPASEPVEMTTMEQEDAVETETESSTGDDKRSERLNEYKEKKRQSLTQAKESRIKSRCSSAQGKVTSVVARVNKIKADRSKVYLEIGEKLDRVIAKAEAAGLDVTELKTARTDLQTEVDAFTLKLDEYLVTLEDLAEMDCAIDPEAFQAALELSRETRASLAQEAEDIRQLVKEDLKQLLAGLKQQLTSSDDEETTPAATETE